MDVATKFVLCIHNTSTLLSINYTPSCFSGLGVASGTVLSGELSRITTKEERTPICSMLMAFSQVGYVMGRSLLIITYNYH